MINLENVNVDMSKDKDLKALLNHFEIQNTLIQKYLLDKGTKPSYGVYIESQPK
jgi:hypothetical protein